MAPQDRHLNFLLYVQPLPASVCETSPSHSLRILSFHHTPHTKFMASTLQLLANIQTNDYVTRMPVDRLEAFLLILVFFVVIILTANGYDYSK